MIEENKIIIEERRKNMYNEMYSFIKTHIGTSFGELKEYFNDSGDTVLCNSRNVIFCLGHSEEFIDTIKKLMDEKKIYLAPCHILIMLQDGCFYKLPIAKQDKHYKKEHWLPVIIKTTDQIKNEKKVFIKLLEKAGYKKDKNEKIDKFLY